MKCFLEANTGFEKREKHLIIYNNEGRNSEMVMRGDMSKVGKWEVRKRSWRKILLKCGC